MGIWCDIQLHPTRLRPLPSHCPHPHIFNAFVPAKHTNRVADLQEHAIVLTFLPGFKYHCPQQVSRSEDEQLCESFPQTVKIVSKIYMYANDFVFLLRITVLPILRLTVHSCMCCSLFVSDMSALSANRQHPPKF